MTDESRTRIALSLEFPKTTGRKPLIAAGCITLVLMLLLAAFSLGVYVGQHGWTRDGLTLQGPGSKTGQPPPANPGAPGKQPPLPVDGRPPDVRGRVQQHLGDSLVLVTAEGPRTIELDEQTQVTTSEGDELPLDVLKRGQPVAIFGQRDDDGKTLVARVIVLLPPPSSKQP
jgi:hypothetical protein